MRSQFTNVTDGRTDRRTDGQTTCDRNTALCTKVHRAVKTQTSQNSTLLLFPVRGNSASQSNLVHSSHSFICGKPSGRGHSHTSKTAQIIFFWDNVIARSHILCYYSTYNPLDVIPFNFCTASLSRE